MTHRHWPLLILIGDLLASTSARLYGESVCPPPRRIRAILKAAYVFLIATTALAGVAHAQSDTDFKAVHQIEIDWQDAWNRNDARALAALACDETDNGATGRAWTKVSTAPERCHADQYVPLAKDTNRTPPDFDVRFLDPSTALVHTYWNLSGKTLPPGTRKSGLLSRVVVKRDDAWRIFASHSTSIHTSSSSAARDTSAIEQLELNWQRAWNEHDMDALASLVTDDVDFVYVGGVWLKGRQEFRDHSATQHASNLRYSTWEFSDVQVRLISADLALVHLRWTITNEGLQPTSIQPPRPGMFTLIVQKRDGRWQIAAAQNTNIAPVQLLP